VLNKDSFSKSMLMPASVRETRAVWKSLYRHSRVYWGGNAWERRSHTFSRFASKWVWSCLKWLFCGCVPTSFC